MKNNTNSTGLTFDSENIKTTSTVQDKITNIFDKEVLLGLASEIASDSLIQDLSEIFFRNLPTTLEAIEKARAAQDTKTLRQNFHSLKGNAATLGMPKLMEMCAGLEHTFRTTSNPTFTQESFDLLKTTSEEASQALFAKNI